MVSFDYFKQQIIMSGMYPVGTDTDEQLRELWGKLYPKEAKIEELESRLELISTLLDDIYQEAHSMTAAPASYDSYATIRDLTEQAQGYL